MPTIRRMWFQVLLLAVFTFLGQNMCVWPAPRFLGGVAMILLGFSGFTLLFFLAAIPASIYYAVSGVVLRKKAGELVLRMSKSLACACFIGLWILALISAGMLRHRAFIQASHVGDRIVQALAQYRNDKGEYPERLDQLLPKYMGEIPYTGMIAYPHFYYEKDVNDIQPKPGEYELGIHCSSGGINFDRFIYWPSETYPDRSQDNGLERIRTWAYVHE